MKLTSDPLPSVETPARSRLWDIAHDLAQAAKVEQSREAFFRKWLSGVLSATGTVAGAVYAATSKRFRSLGQLGDLGDDQAAGEVAEQRRNVRLSVIEKRKPIWIREPNFPNERITLIAPLGAQNGGVVEVMLPTSMATHIRQRGCTTFVLQAIAFIDDFLLREQVRTLTRKQELCEEVLRFVGKIHANLDLHSTAYAIANEGRRLSECDRLIVLRRYGRGYRTVAISGQDRFDLRSPAIKKLTTFVSAVAATGEVYSSDGTVAPQLEDALADYLDESHVKHLTVVPLAPKNDETDVGDETLPKSSRKPIGALVFERHTPTFAATGYAERVAFLSENATLALANALELERIFFLSLWRKLGGLNSALFAPGARYKTAAVLLALIGFLAAMIFVPAEFSLHSRGAFQPVERRNVFAPIDGIVTTLHVRHGDQIEAGGRLLELRNTELEVAMTEARGERTGALEQLAAVERALHGDGAQIKTEERIRLSGQRAELNQKISSLDEKLKILERKREGLKVMSPIAGEVTTWNLQRLLHDRPVTQGQQLMTVADLSRSWELELYLPEHYIGHLMRARRDSDEPVQVRFRPTSDPSQEFVGVIKEVDSIAEVRGEYGNSVLITVVVDATQMPPLKPGLEATAKVLCGRRSLGYVWLHDLADFLEAKVLFRLY